jgi:hypothetical protein
MRQLRPDLVDHAANLYDPSRSDSENLNRMLDHVSQFTGPLNREDQIGAEFELNDEVARKKGLKFDPGF